MDFGPDDALLATGTEDGSVYVWTYPNGELLRKLPGHRGFVTDVQVLKDGKVLSVGIDGSLRCWKPGDTHSRLIGLAKGSINAFCISPDGSTAYLGTSEAAIEVWDIREGKRTFEFPGHAKGVQCLSLSSKGNILVSGGWDGKVRFWDIHTRTESTSLSFGDSPITSLAVSADGRTILVGHLSMGVQSWDASTGKQLRTLSEGTPLYLRRSDDGARILAGFADGSIRIWDAATLRESRYFRPKAAVLSSKAIAVTSDGKFMLSQHRAVGVVDTWDLISGAEVRPRAGHSAGVLTIAYSPTSMELASGALDGTVIIWNTETGQIVRQWGPLDAGVYSLAYSRDGTILACAAGHRIIAWDTRSGKVLQDIGDPRGKKVTSVIFGVSAANLVSCSIDGTLVAWDMKSARPSFETSTEPSLMNKVLAPSPDGKTFALGDESGVIFLYSTELMSLNSALPIPQGKGRAGLRHVRAITYSPNGKWLAAVLTSTVLVWDLSTRALVTQFNQEANERGFAGVAFSADAKLIAISREDGSVTIRRTTEWVAVDSFVALDGVARCVAFSPQRSSFSIGGYDTTVRVYKDKWER